jgi:cysteinyl-tRNA synthetase
VQIYNTLTRRIEQIVPRERGCITMYTCGPTVYRNVHAGNLRTLAMADWLRRALEYQGVAVVQVKNITDVGHMRMEALDRGEDKIIAQARKEGRTSAEIAAFYTQAFHADECKLNILPAAIFPRATEHIPEMIAIVQGLLERGVAYEVDGNVFFDVTRFPAYGRLSGNRIAQALEEVVRGEMVELKRHPEDFALWKRAEAGREMAWDSPWARGFPGWHIECSAMAMRYLGPHIDVHTGGVDNIFPHHEDEIAQSEAYTGERFVTYWVHAQHLLSDGLKMAKSTGNAYTLADVEARGYAPLALRYFYTTAHYRSRINFTFGALSAAQTGLRRLRQAVIALAERADGTCPGDEAFVAQWRARFLDTINDDLNLPRAMAALWDMLRAGAAAPDVSARAQLNLVLDLDRILGFDLAADVAAARALGTAAAWRDQATLAQDPPPTVVALRDERAHARAARDYATADGLRAQLLAGGWQVRDGRAGTLVLPRAPEDEFVVLSRSSDAPDHRAEADRYRLSVNLLAHNSRADLERCIASLLRHGGGPDMELVIVDNGSSDDTLAYLRGLARRGLPGTRDGVAPALQVLFVDQEMGVAAGHNAGLRASRGRIIVLLDTSIELRGDVWPAIEAALSHPSIGVVGPYGLVTDDLREFHESGGPDVDAIEGYLLAFQRALLPEVGLLDERFRFYRLLDVHFSFFAKAAGYRVVALPEVAAQLEKHPHREWESLSEEERATRSKKNYDLFRARWHHGESLLVANYMRAHRWRGHDHPRHIAADHTHVSEDLPPAGEAHSHLHHHWPDHAHEHPHRHEALVTYS